MIGPQDQVRRTIELASRYYPTAVRAANKGFSVYSRVQPQLRQLAQQIRESEDYPRYLLVKSFTFARGGWHNAPLMDASAGAIRALVKDLADRPDEEVKREIDTGIPAYFREDDHGALRDMIDGWDLFPEWRERIVEDAFKAHKDGKYTLSVSTLAPQIEGMLREETGEYGNNSNYMWTINRALNLNYDRQTPPASPSVEALEDSLEKLRTMDLRARYQEAERISQEHALFRVNELYNWGDFSKPEFVTSTNRHAIVHGVFKDFSEIASLKLFCAVQLVHEIVDGYREAVGSSRREDQEVDKADGG
jgi:hypothetical protein